eukprot:c26366_g1_i1.p1 GENE.c26366_g1_i1~~c26366_g1_i1.p1  ORF type:complete len:244 (-),score=69.86 c26366_g1_i1:115-813(-)
MAGLTDDDVQSQIEQMIKFIKQEAEEKADEIRVKSTEEFNILKQEEVEAEKKKIRQEYERKEKQVDVQKKISHSNAINQNRLRVLKARDDSVKSIMENVRQEIVKIAQGPGYKDLLRKLIIQGATTLEETHVSVRYRKEDESLIQSVLKEAEQAVKAETGKAVTLTLDTKEFLPPGGSGPNTCSGGVELLALGGAIRCDNTLDTRTGLAYESLLPDIRITLFGRSESRKHLS